MKKTPKIFISYSWKDEPIANSIDNDFSKVGINFIRDVRDNNYKSSLKEFMQKVRKTDYVLMIISDSYLKSINCMYEVIELIKETDYSNRVLQIILDDADVYTPTGRLSYIKYWQGKYDSLKKEISSLDPKCITFSSVDLKHIDNILSNIGEFLDLLSSQLSIPFSKLKKNGYLEILEYIKFPRNKEYYKLLKILNIKDEEKKDVEIFKFIFDNPRSYLGYTFKAYIEFERKKFFKAILFYDKAIELNPEYYHSFLIRGVAYRNIENYSKALKDVNKANEIEPNNANVYSHRAYIYKCKGDFYKAIDDYNKSIEIDPKIANTRLNRGFVFFKLNKFDEALDDYNCAINLNPEYALAYYNRGFLYKKLGEIDMAIEDYSKAIELKVKDIEIYKDRADAYLIKGLDSLAKQDIVSYNELK